jgi:hypothetical protein
MVTRLNMDIPEEYLLHLKEILQKNSSAFGIKG